MNDKHFKAVLDEFSKSMDKLLQNTLDVLGTDMNEKLSKGEADRAVSAARDVSDGIIKAAFESAIAKTAKLLGIPYTVDDDESEDDRGTKACPYKNVEGSECHTGNPCKYNNVLGAKCQSTSIEEEEYDDEASIGVIMGTPERCLLNGKEMVKVTTQHGDCFLPKELFDFNFMTINTASGVSEDDAEDVYNNSEVSMASVGGDALAGVIRLPNDSVFSEIIKFEPTCNDKPIEVDYYKEILEERFKNKILNLLDFVHDWAIMGI